MVRRDLVSTEKVPSLTKLAHVASLTLIDKISKINQFPGNQILEFKQRVLSLPKHLIDEIFNAAFYNTHSNVVSTKIVSFDKIVNKMRFYPASLLSSLRGFRGEELFNLWWLFFDEYYTTKIGFEINCLKFSGELISYLKKINSCVLQDLVISYNWILRQDFKFILDHLKHLKHLTIFAPFGSEMNILDDISNSKCQLKSFKFGRHQKGKKLNKRAILEFLEAQHEEIESLDMTDWMRNLHINERLVVFAYFRNCKKLKTLKIHFKDIDGRSSLVHPCEGGLKDDEFWAVLVDNLPKAQIKDFTIDFCGVNYVDDLTDIVCNESWFMWLKSIPVDLKVRFKDLQMKYFDTEEQPVISTGLFKQVVEIDNLKLISGSIIQWMIKSDWRDLEKLTMNVSYLANPTFVGIPPQTINWCIEFPNLKEAILNIGEHHFFYSSFMGIILGSKHLENLSICFKDENAIRRFNEVDFEDQLQTVKSLNLKMLSITCSTRRQPMPYKSFLSLVKKCPDLKQINFDLSPEQIQVFQGLGFIKV